MTTRVDKDLYIIKNGSEDYGPFESVESAKEWGKKFDEELGDWYITDLYAPRED